MTDDSGYEARHQIALAVYRLTGGLGDPRYVHHDPLAALRALTALRAAVTRAEMAAARRAREDGTSWSRIGEELGFAGDPEPGMTSVAERAFQRFAADFGDGPSFTWSCPSCGGLISDGGPEVPPNDAERGHSEGCARFAAAVAAWDAQWNEGDDRDE